MEKLPSGSFFVTREEIRENSEKLLCAALRHNLIHAAIGGIPLLFTLLSSLFTGRSAAASAADLPFGGENLTNFAENAILCGVFFTSIPLSVYPGGKMDIIEVL